MKKETIKVYGSTRIVEFEFEGKLYTYKYISQPGSGLAYIFKGKNLVYSPYVNQCTKEGNRVYNEYMKDKHASRIV